MELEALPLSLMRELGLTNQDIDFLGDVRVRQEDEIGRGSDAVVYRLSWQGIDIALKVLHPILIEPGVQDRERKIRSFGQEVFRLSRIHHPNLCQLLGIARVGRNAALALELLTSTLEKLSIGEDREDGLKLIGYLCDTSAGIRYLHVRGILHRDLAPKNVMIKNGVAKVCDFGMAKLVRLASPRQQQQQVQAARMDMTRCPGTLVFMPPEALVEQPDYDRPLDIFSFGVMLLAVITGVMPGIDLINAPSVVIVQDASGRETTRVVAETRRRAAYLRRLADDHPLKTLAVRSHSNEPSERPTAEEAHEEMKRVLQLFTSLSLPHISNVPPAVVRRLDSFSEQLTQQATSITVLSARSDTLEEQLTTAITNNQTTTQQQLTATHQQLAAAITNNQTTTQQQLTATQQQLAAAITNNQTTTRQQLTATQQEVSTLRNEQTTTRHQVQALTDRLNGTNDRLDHQTTTLTDQLSDTDQRLHQQTNTLTQTSLQISSLRDLFSCVSDKLSRLSASTRQLQVSAPSPATVPGSVSSSATASATTARAEATAAASTTEFAVGRGYHLLPAMPTRTQLENIKIRRKWNKLVEVRHHGKIALVATYSDKLVAVWLDGDDITEITQTSDLQTWRSIDLPSEYSKLQAPSLASHGGMLYMHCFMLPKSTDTWVGSILQYCDTPDNGDGSRGGGGGGGRRRQWAKVTDVTHYFHAWCSLRACDDTISLYGGEHRGTKHKHVSTYLKCSLASKQWSSSSPSKTSRAHALPSLPLPCIRASLVTFPDSLYIVGGDTGCFFKHHDGRWVFNRALHGVELKFSAACALSEHSMVICPRTPSAECVVHDILSKQSYPLPAIPAVGACTPSLTLFGSTLVLSVGGCEHGSLYTLDMSV